MNFRDPQALRLGRRKHVVLHYVIAGEGAIHIDGHHATTAQSGTLILVPAFAGHTISTAGVYAYGIPQCQPLDAAMLHLTDGEGPSSLTAVCGRVSIVYRGLSGTMDLIRAPLVEHLGALDCVRSALDEFVTELASPTIGSHALARSLLLQCLILLMRKRLRAGDPAMQWMRGLTDESLWNAMQTMLDHPGSDHTVDSLAELAAMSRARFAARFHEAFGTGPINLLKDIRLRRAAELLSHSSLPFKTVAGMVGYRSRTYFSRAFKAEHGVSPDAFRMM